MSKKKENNAKNTVQKGEHVEWIPRHVLNDVRNNRFSGGMRHTGYKSSEKNPLIFKNTWFLGYMGYSDVWEVVPIIDFSNSHEYWQMVHWTPYPSELLISSSNQQRGVQALPIGNIRSLFLFRKADLTTGSPMVVEMGPHMQVVYRYEVKDMDDATLDHEWEEISLGSIGESINQESWALQGVRVLDRTKQPNVSHRFEFWCAKEAPDVEKFARGRSKLHKGKFSISRAK